MSGSEVGASPVASQADHCACFDCPKCPCPPSYCNACRPLRLGSLCTGYGGLDLAIESVLPVAPSWLCEIEDAPAQVCDVRFPGVPNLHDLTAIDWSNVAPVDVLSAGYPCQPFSAAGRRKGTNDVRHLWPFIAEAVRVLRPRLVVLENVAGHRSLGFGDVLRDLARIGYVGSWESVRASDVGACHRRERVFILATDADFSGRDGREPLKVRGSWWRTPATGVGQDVLANAHGWGLKVGGEHDGGAIERCLEAPRRDDVDRLGTPATDPSGEGRGQQGHAAGSREAGSGTPARPARSGEGTVEWGDFAAAIRRHEVLAGRPAPRPVDDRGRLAPRFVEWMMCLPAGWVTDILTNRSKALKCLGNGVVPPQAAFALAVLLPRLVEPQEVAA